MLGSRVDAHVNIAPMFLQSDHGVFDITGFDTFACLRLRAPGRSIKRGGR
jgi:hypothetical protein